MLNSKLSKFLSLLTQQNILLLLITFPVLIYASIKFCRAKMFKFSVDRIVNLHSSIYNSPLNNIYKFNKVGKHTFHQYGIVYKLFEHVFILVAIPFVTKAILTVYSGQIALFIGCVIAMITMILLAASALIMICGDGENIIDTVFPIDEE